MPFNLTPLLAPLAGTQLESSTGMCPFIVEHDGMRSPAEGGGWRATSVAEAARMVVEYLGGRTATS